MSYPPELLFLIWLLIGIGLLVFAEDLLLKAIGGFLIVFVLVAFTIVTIMDMRSD